MKALETNRTKIAAAAVAKDAENVHFRDFLLKENPQQIDSLVHAINELVSPAIDCTQCGACCKTLMINVTHPEVDMVASHMNISSARFKEQYIEESMQGNLIMNSIPCHFLEGSKCSIYEQRFAECRNFPHLDRSNFNNRLFGTMMYYAMCPIIFNVVEELKIATGFKTDSINKNKNNPI